MEVLGPSPAAEALPTAFPSNKQLPTPGKGYLGAFLGAELEVFGVMIVSFFRKKIFGAFMAGLSARQHLVRTTQPYLPEFQPSIIGPDDFAPREKCCIQMDEFKSVGQLATLVILVNLSENSFHEKNDFVPKNAGASRSHFGARFTTRCVEAFRRLGRQAGLVATAGRHGGRPLVRGPREAVGCLLVAG